MGSISFVVKSKKQRIKINYKALLLFMLCVAFLCVSLLFCFIVVKFNKNFLSTIKLPKIRPTLLVIYIIGLVTYILLSLSLFFSFKFEQNKKQMFVAIVFNLTLNVLVCLCFFVLHSLALSVLLMLSNFALCCFYIKLLKPATLGLYLFCPYFLFNFFCLTYLYIVYLIN